MKTVTLDWETYQSELSAEHRRGFSAAGRRLLAARTAVEQGDYNEACLILHEDYDNDDALKIIAAIGVPSSFIEQVYGAQEKPE